MNDLKTKLIAKIVEQDVGDDLLENALAVFSQKETSAGNKQDGRFMSVDEACAFSGNITKFIVSQAYTTKNEVSTEK